MELKLLRAFLTVTELRHFGRAADALHVSQPALSKQIAALETVLGGRLFERGRHGADLTAFGESFRPGALSLIGEADDLLIRAREASSGQRGQLRVGLGLSVLTVAPQWLASFRSMNPGVGVTVKDLSSSDQTRALLSGQLDVGFLRLPADRGLAFVPVLAESLILAVPEHARWKRLPADLNKLNALGIVALSRGIGPGLAAQIEQWCASRNFIPRVIQRADDIQSVLAAVAAGVGAAFLPSGAQYLLRDATIIALHDSQTRWQVGLAWNTMRSDPVVDNFVAHVQKSIENPL
ncbi:LysR family transcriptional regulator [Caballeronia sordidicola]|jgi:DNA-binding transcriptional LysR family regulator|uniref:Transcriptional regulator n=1 Tax=Caballeronia sordidicola TaxID=196367 RepID=A0A242MW05_CABSO|nr:LysR substrate-binding domain-containing protein [Caballeronia sordidicola]OTP75503.1 Transcriptional regulator [Caballeronia sordidicola]